MIDLTCDFWEQLKTDFSDVLNRIYQRLRIQNVSYEGASAVMELIFPRGKNTIYNDFTDSGHISIQQSRLSS